MIGSGDVGGWRPDFAGNNLLTLQSTGETFDPAAAWQAFLNEPAPEQTQSVSVTEEQTPRLTSPEDAHSTAAWVTSQVLGDLDRLLEAS